MFGSLLLTFWISDFPHNRATLWLLIPAFGAVLGTVDTARCIGRRWSLRHGGVILCLYMDLMALTLIFFSLLWPFIVLMRDTH